MWNLSLYTSDTSMEKEYSWDSSKIYRTKAQNWSKILKICKELSSEYLNICEMIEMSLELKRFKKKLEKELNSGLKKLHLL